MEAVKTPYELAVESRVGDRDVIRFRTADGVHSKRSLRPAATLLADELWERSPAETLVVDANYGVTGTLIAPRTRVTMTTASARAGRLARVNVAHAGRSARVGVTADPTRLPRRFDAACYALKPYTPIAMGKRRTLDALRTLRPDGTLWLAARDAAGCSRYESCLATVGAEPVEVRQVGETRLLRAERPTTVNRTVVEPSRRPVTVAGTTTRLVTVPGVFAAPELDDGTRHLLEHVVPGGERESADDRTVGDEDRVLDACCGAGPIAATVGRATDADLWASDDDPVAVACARRTLAASGVDATVRLGDCLGGIPRSAFDRVLCNPPTHAGSDVLRELFVRVERALAPGGICSLVHHRSLSFAEYLAPFDRVRDGACDGTYRIRHCE